MKDLFKWAIPLTLFTLCVILGAQIFQRAAAREEIRAQILHLPAFKLPAWKGGVFSASQVPPGNPTVVVHFDPHCDHCHYEAREALRYQETLPGTWIWVSEAMEEEIGYFLNTYPIDTLSNHHVLLAQPGQVYQTFGLMSVPSISIYGADRRRIRSFQGETRLDLIIKTLEAS